MIKHGGSTVQFIHNKPSDLWFRKYGALIYLMAIALVIGLAPNQFSLAPSILTGFSPIPALGALSKSTIFPGGTAAWLISSVLLYPLIHLSIRSRMLDRNLTSGMLTKFLLAVLALDIVLVILAVYGSYSINMPGVGGKLFRLLATDSFGLLMLGSMLSLAYSTAIAITRFSISSAIKSNEET